MVVVVVVAVVLLLLTSVCVCVSPAIQGCGTVDLPKVEVRMPNDSRTA